MKKLCLIRQPAGLGDIFFCQKLARKLISDKGFKIAWPIIPEFKWLPGYMNVFPDITYCLTTADFPGKQYYINRSIPLQQHYNTILSGIQYDEFLYLPLQDSTMWTKSSEMIMHSKYNMIGLGWEDWCDHFMFDRIKNREEELLKHFGVQKGDKFNLVNRYFASPPNVEKVDTIHIQNDYPVIEMEFLGWDNLFDWCGLAEQAVEIHTVETAICYLIEKLNTTDKLFMYHRKKYHSDFNYMTGIFKKSWLYEGRDF